MVLLINSLDWYIVIILSCMFWGRLFKVQGSKFKVRSVGTYEANFEL